jgi:NACalpha-BTF3-like transcription factor
MLCGRVMSHSNTLRLSRATFTPSDSAEETGGEHFKWIKSIVIERVTRAALFDVTCTKDMRSLWNTHLYDTVQTKTQRGRHISAANRRTRICKEILKKALGSHAVINAFFPLDFGSDHGVFGHTFSDLMHVLEEGIFKYLLSVFLLPLSDTTAGDLDDLATKLLGPEANRCHGMRLFPRVNFTRGFTRLTLLSSEERVGELLALVILLQTDQGQAILEDRFSPGFDARRMSRAAQFSGNRNNNPDEDMEAEDEVDDEDETETIDDDDIDINTNNTTASRREATFRPTQHNIHFVCAQISRHDLSFLHQDVFPNLPARHVLECLKIIWKMTFRLANSYDIVLPPGSLNLPPFRVRRPDMSSPTPFSAQRLCRTFGADWERQNHPPLVDEGSKPTITNDPKEFVACCEKLLTLRSFYNYGGEHCPTAIPWKPDGSFDVELVQERTDAVAESLKVAVNRGQGTNGWRIPKFIDMLHLPTYMSRLGCTGRLHVGFAERGLKNWAKKPARTAQKRGGGVFEGQCAARIRERSMMDHALTQMDSEEEEVVPGEEDGDIDNPSTEDPGVGGSCYHIVIERDAAPHQQRKIATCTRLDSRKRVHRIQNNLPITLLHYFKKLGKFDEVIELRTEATIDGTVYRVHPNYRGEGPWYDYATVRFEFEPTPPPDYRVLVNDHQRFPAKLVAFYRVLPDTEYQVLAHCAEFQTRTSNVYSRRTLLTRSWLYEVAAGQRPLYRNVGGVRNNVHVDGHLFAIEEIPGFHGHYPTDKERRFVVLSDMRKVWPSFFINPSNL